MNAFIISALLQLALAVLLLVILYQAQQQRRSVHHRLGKSAAVDKERLLHEFGRSRLGKKGLSLDVETMKLLDQLGWRKNSRKALFVAIQFGLPVVLVVLLQLIGLVLEGEAGVSWLAMLFVFGIGYIVPKRVLASAVKKRKQRLVVEIESALPLLRILFEVGMVVEQALRILAVEGRQILPELSAELRLLLQRVDAGLDLQGELHRTAQLVDVDEVSDCFVVLEQLSRQGSGAMASLQAMKELLSERRVTALQEKISKMSAKMSIVMVGFLFPALMIVLAGPGFIAIIRAFGEMG
ncbi:type II secretion system F family protein [Zobellella iuensis]|uniref:Type II secretion system F family protein n=1 Tax=Zobellella iuensis TaxID=2803811 RepID=A0ABS1QP12_9GAMM|nr:type II secretion system F family protein [Zobellella iuensis]MBL1376601.1 type II secretion system F family protein [Zobellella iuensis]